MRNNPVRNGARAMKTDSTESADGSRRELVIGLLAALGAGAVSCAASENGNPEALANTVEALSGQNFLWVDAIGTAASPLALRAKVGSAGTICVAQGFWSAGDGGGGIFYWDTNSAPDDGGIFVIPTGRANPGPGWRRISEGGISKGTAQNTRRGGPVSVKWWGARGDGTGDDSPAIQSAVNYVAAWVGSPPPNNTPLSIGGAGDERPAGHVHFPGGRYQCASPLVFHDMGNVMMSGPAELRYTGIGTTPFITLDSCYRFTFQDLIFSYDNGGGGPNVFTGNLVQTGHSPMGNDPALNHWVRCTFFGWDVTPGRFEAAALLALHESISSKVTGCHFSYARVGILGVIPNIAFSNQIQIDDCTFLCLTTGIRNPGEVWEIHGCTFEPSAESLPGGALDQDPTYRCLALSFHGNWCGDASGVADASLAWLRATGTGISIVGNMFSITSPGAAIELSGSQGVHISGNHIIGETRFKNNATYGYNYAVMLTGNFHQSDAIDWTNVVGFTVLATDQVASTTQVSVPFSIGNDPRGLVTEFASQVFQETPGLIDDGAKWSQTFPLSGIHSSDAAVTVGAVPPLPDDVLMTAAMSGSGACQVVLRNKSGMQQLVPTTNFRLVAFR